MKTNLSYLESMTEGNQGLIEEMIGIFTEQVNEFGKRMETCYHQQHWQELSKLAHTAKSSVAIMGMNELAGEMKDLEMMAKEEREIERYPDYLNKFRNDCEEALAELNDYLMKKQ